MRPVRVLVVEDSRTVRERLVEILGEDPTFEVVGQTGDGTTALHLCETVRPDVVSLDMVLPGMSGLEVTRRVMSTRATPILIVSSSTNRGEAFSAFEALQAGAVEIFEKSRMGSGVAWERDFKAILRLVARIRVVTRPNQRAQADSGHVLHVDPTPPVSRCCTQSDADRPSATSIRNSLSPGSYTARRLIVLGASAGGPAALAQLLGELPKGFDIPILVVLHMTPLFAPSLAEWLSKQTCLEVRLATDGEPLPAPRAPAPVILAPPGVHMVVSQGRLRLTEDRERHSCRPSVDVLFESVAAELGPRVIAGVLTGMGKDGAAGLLALRRAGALTFAQDERSSVVYGMPQEAVRLGAAELVLPLEAIAKRLLEISRGGEERSAG